MILPASNWDEGILLAPCNILPSPGSKMLVHSALSSRCLAILPKIRNRKKFCHKNSKEKYAPDPAPFCFLSSDHFLSYQYQLIGVTMLIMKMIMMQWLDGSINNCTVLQFRICNCCPVQGGRKNLSASIRLKAPSIPFPKTCV